MPLEEIVQCLHQLCRPKIKLPKEYFKEYGCKTCTYDPANNKNCPGYVQVKLIKYEVGVRK